MSALSGTVFLISGIDWMFYDNPMIALILVVIAK